MNQFHELKSPRNETVQANYNKLSDHIRRLTPQGIQCSVFCGGEKCKYENPENWKPDSLAIQGIYSHWWVKGHVILISTQRFQQVKQSIFYSFLAKRMYDDVFTEFYFRSSLPLAVEEKIRELKVSRYDVISKSSLNK